MQYWLMKTDPDTFAWADLKKAPGRTTSWEGVRNYQARNYMRDMRCGDLVLFYHSAVQPQLIPGIAEIVREAYPDSCQFDPGSPYHDPRSPAKKPRWDMVDIRWVRDYEPPITREELKGVPEMQGMVLFQPGSRLSVMPVTAAEWLRIQALRSA
ncbi:MAG: EVE domain-containing protein [Acidobacteria bacterium]|nr:EVE domain-containing protein [Acidobacteriota bacterium]